MGSIQLGLLTQVLLGVDEFVILNPLSGEVFRTGREEIAHLGLNPDACEMTVQEDGTLCIQSGKGSSIYDSLRWCRVK